MAMPGMDRLEWEGDYSPALMKLISFLRARRLIRRGCLAFLAHLWNTFAKVPSIELVYMVCDF